ncbi:ATP-binding protein [Cohnella soli]|uniref:ATP-binding protein n=1 Tax=Cohnella soli TaxID=425005 RepID=A0ABW0HLB3_9BACL
MIPISLLQGNVVFDDTGAPYAVYIIEPVPYAFQNKNIKIGAIEEVAKALYGIVGEMYVYLLAKQYSADQVAEQMMEFSSSPGWVRQVGYAREHLEKELPYHRVNYVVLPLKKRMSIYYDQDKIRYIKEVGMNAWQGIRDVAERLMRPVFGRDLMYTMQFLESMQEQSDEMLDKLSGFKRVRKATMRECEWWLKKGYHRGISDPELLLPDPFPTQVRTGQDEVRRVLPIKASLVTLSKLTKEHLDYMATLTDEGTAYHSYMPILSVPPDIDEHDPTGYEWIYGTVEKLDFPVDTALKITLEAHEDAKKKVKRRRKVVWQQVKEWVGGKQEVPEEIIEDLDGINDVLRKFRQTKMPLVYMTGVFAIGASSPEQLRSRKKKLAEEADKLDVIVANSPGDQQKMFQHFYPFAKKSLPQRWEIPMEPGTIGAGVPFGVRKLGDPTGFYLGEMLGTRRPVFMNPKRPAMDKSLNRASTILIVGVPGSGKTATAKYIIDMMVEWGAYGYIEDPKGDFDRFFEHPTISKEGRMVSFTPGSATRFTPFRLSKDESQRVSAATTIMELMLNPNGSATNEVRGFVIDEALVRLYRGEKWDMNHFEVEMEWISENHPKDTHKYEAEMCLGHIKKFRHNLIGSLMYGDDTGESLFDRKVLIAITRGLVIPDRRKKSVAEWSDDERISAALKYATSSLGLEQLMSLPPYVLKFLDLEEYWILKSFPGGKALVEKAIRFSRFTNMTVILSTQNPTDPEEDESDDSDDVTGLFSWKIILRLDSQDQVASALKLMGMTEERAKDWVQQFSVVYKNGIGLVKDPEGNIGEIRVRPLDPELMYYLESTPEEQKKDGGGRSA